jgi:hypothetical protein
MRFVTHCRAAFRDRVFIACSCLLTVAVAAVTLAAGAAHGQEPQGGTRVNHTIFPGVVGDLVSDIVGFYQRYRVYILGLLAFVFLRWLWRVVTPRGRRD